jgi:hypothetical protein
VSFAATESFVSTESSDTSSTPDKSLPEELELDVSSQATRKSAIAQAGKSLFSMDVPFFIMNNLARPCQKVY